MAAKKNLKILLVVASGAAIFTGAVQAVLNDEAVRNYLIELLLPVLEKFLRQHELEVVNAINFVFA